MLVLTRKVDECINIGDDIEIRVIEVKGGNVRLGINAPSRIPIYRQEIYDKIQKQNVQASKGVWTNLENVAELLRSKGLKEER